MFQENFSKQICRDEKDKKSIFYKNMLMMFHVVSILFLHLRINIFNK